MHQKQNNQQDDELDLSGEPPVIEIDDTDESISAPNARPASTRASSAAAERARAKERARQKSRSSSSASKNPYRTRTAAEIRAERDARKRRTLTELSDDPRERRRAAAAASVLPMEKVMELLHNPTRFVSENELRSEYAYVIADLRSMAVLSLGLVILLFLLAQFLPR